MTDQTPTAPASEARQKCDCPAHCVSGVLVSFGGGEFDMRTAKCYCFCHAEKADEPQCRCELHRAPGFYPICGKPFNPEHPSEALKGAACGNPKSPRGVCGHDKACHTTNRADPGP